MPLDPGIALSLQAMAAANLPPVAGSDPITARAVLRQISLGGNPPSGAVPVDSVRDDTIAGVPVRVYAPQHAAPIPTIVFFHGGGFVIGDLDTHDEIARRLSRDIGAVVVSVDYRLAPEHPFPAAADDAEAALASVVERLDEFGGDPGRVAVAGDSAGANLAAVAALAARDRGIPLAAQLLAYPTVDPGGHYASVDENAEGYFLTRDDMEWFFSNYLGMPLDDPRVAGLTADPRVSPLLTASLAGAAPAIVATAQFDPLRDEGDAYAVALADAGVQVDHRQFAGLIHGFYGMGATSEGAEEAAVWINARLKERLG